MKLKIQNGAIDINGNTILEKIDFEINDSEHVAIVGKNGAGKTTLLKAIINTDNLIEGTGEDSFQVIKIGNFKIGYLEQIKMNDNLTLFEELVSSFTELLSMERKMTSLESNLTSDKNIMAYNNLLDQYKTLGGYTYKKEIEVMISSFGFLNDDKDKLLSSFSGGEKMKISFMKLLLLAPDLLILDEPTNHLDITTIEWLENYLRNYKKAFIIVSHDRMFLDNTVNIIYNIEYGETIRYVGNYTKFIELKNERISKLKKDYEYQQKEIKRLQSIYERFRSKPTKAKMALSKLKQIERMVILEKPRKEDNKTFNANLKDIAKPGKIVLNAKDLEFGYNSVLGKVNIELERGKKLGIIGANGTGKSTLLKTLAKMINPLSGKVNYGFNVSTSYFDQNLEFKTKGTVLEEFRHIYPDVLEEDARRALGSFLFTGCDVDKMLNVLSGGEKVRLLLCEIFYSKANLLFLDEPTNHLDIISKEKLENTLKSYHETVIFVSHDRYFVNTIADSLLVFKDNNVTYYPYGYEEYIEEKKNIVPDSIANPKPVKAKDFSVDNKTKVNANKIAKELDSLYKKLDKLKEAQFNPENYSDYKKASELEEKINNLQKEISIKEVEWEKYL